MLKSLSVVVFQYSCFFTMALNNFNKFIHSRFFIINNIDDRLLKKKHTKNKIK
jgi:hypothetical protein